MYWAISSLMLVSKIVERLVCCQLTVVLNLFTLLPGPTVRLQETSQHQNCRPQNCFWHSTSGRHWHGHVDWSSGHICCIQYHSGDDCYQQACTQHSHSGIVLTHWCENGVFAPQGWHIAPINVKFGMVYSPMPNFMLSGQKCGNIASEPGKIWNSGHKFSSQGRLVCTIFTKFSAFVRVYR